jgi:hypothetical protein
MAKQRNSATAPRCWALMRCLGIAPSNQFFEVLAGRTTVRGNATREASHQWRDRGAGESCSSSTW